MNTHNRRVDHLDGCIMGSSQCVHDPTPHPSSTPANEAIVAGGMRTKIVRQVSPRRPRTQHPKDAVKDTTIIHPRYAARLVRQHRLDGSPLVVGEVVAHDSPLPVWEFESQALWPTSIRLPLSHASWL